jgi:hypothetical protein
MNLPHSCEGTGRVHHAIEPTALHESIRRSLIAQVIAKGRTLLSTRRIVVRESIRRSPSSRRWEDSQGNTISIRGLGTLTGKEGYRGLRHRSAATRVYRANPDARAGKLRLLRAPLLLMLRPNVTSKKLITA